MRLYILAVSICAAVVPQLCSGSIVTDDMRTAAKRIQDKSLARAASQNDTAWDRLAEVVDTFGPRFSGSDSLQSALAWFETQIRADGLNVSHQDVMVPSWVRGDESLEMVSPRQQKLHFVGLGSSAGTGGAPLVADVEVFSSFQEFDDMIAIDPDIVQGKIVLWNAPFVTYGETVAYRSRGGSTIKPHGGVASLVRSIGPYSMQSPHTGGTANVTGVPQAAVSLEDAGLIARMRARGQKVTVRLIMGAHWLPERKSRNILITIPGTELPDEYVVFGGHSDSWDIAPGAMDDGGGIVSSWEAMRLLHELELKPKRTIMGVFWVNEEDGARGGQEFARAMGSKLDKVTMAIETDIGAFAPFGLGVAASAAATATMRDLSQLLVSINASEIRIGGEGTDIEPTCEKGVPCASLLVVDPRLSLRPNNPCLMPVQAALTAGGITDVARVPDASRYYDAGYFWYHHTESDTPDKMDVEELQLTAATLATYAYALAQAPDLLSREGSEPSPTPEPPAPTPYAHRLGCEADSEEAKRNKVLGNAVIALSLICVVLVVALVGIILWLRLGSTQRRPMAVQLHDVSSTDAESGGGTSAYSSAGGMGDGESGDHDFATF